jgi:hypothetical protein
MLSALSTLSIGQAKSSKQDGKPTQDELWNALLSEKHDGVAADLQRLRVEMKMLLDEYKHGMEERLRTLERLSDAHGRALKNVLGRDPEEVAQHTAAWDKELTAAQQPQAAGEGEVGQQLANEQAILSEPKADLSDEIAELRSMIKKSNSDGPFVPLSRYECDLKTIEVDRDLVMVKSGYLVLAASESNEEERRSIFNNLKRKEVSLRSQRPVSLLQLPDTSSFTGDAAQAIVNLQEQAEAADSTFTIMVDCSGNDKLGVTVNSKDGEALVVEKIGDGLLRSWNKGNFQHAVKPGDLIIAVNGKSGGVDALKEELQQQQQENLTITIQRAHAVSMRV